MNLQMIKAVRIAGVSIPLICFFLPWASVELTPVIFLNKFFKSSAKTEMVRISGFDIPCMANNENSKAIQSVLKVFVSDAKNADKKSYLIFLVPVMAVVLAWLTGPATENKILAVCLGITGVGFFAAATVKVLLANLDNMAVIVHISPAFWLTLLSYLALGILNIHQYMHIQKQS